MRLTGIFKPSDYPGTPDETTQAGLATLFGTFFPGVEDPAFDDHHAGMAIAAHHPKFALELGMIGRTLILESGWGQRAVLRELAIAALNLHFKSDYSFQSRLPAVRRAGVPMELLAALPYWRTSPMFDAEQRLVIEYTMAVVTGDVPEDLFARVVAAFGEKETVEFTSIVGLWSMWAMLINAARPEVGKAD
jgi:alkylhydroperoxidase family enzyme